MGIWKEVVVIELQVLSVYSQHEENE